MIIKTPAVCLLLVIYMIGFYYRKPHIPIKSTRIFQVLAGTAVVNVLFDLITIYTVNHRNIVPNYVNLTAHIIYLMSILSFIYILFLYMRSYLEGKITFQKKIMILQALPFGLSSLGILILPITYVQGEMTDYSLGPKAYALYGSIVIYLILILYYCLRYWEILDREKRVAIILAVPIFVLISVIQMLIPETLLVVAGSTLILLGLILSNENAEKYVDEKTALFNQYAFEKVLEEFDFDRQKALIAVLCFSRTENNYDWKQDGLILREIYKEIRGYRLRGYRICENGVVFLGNTEERVRMILEEVKSAVEEKFGKDNITIETKLLSDEEASTRYNCMQNIIAFCTETGRHFAYIDYLTHIFNRNALERDLVRLDEKGGAGSYYLIADLNDLKLVNDTIGHSAGDKLLQGFAGLLESAAGDAGRAYRQGGDEFAVLYSGDVQKFMRDLAERCKAYNRLSSIPVSYAIGYCSLDDVNFMNIADSMMYENKRRIKQQKNR